MLRRVSLPFVLLLFLAGNSAFGQEVEIPTSTPPADPVASGTSPPVTTLEPDAGSGQGMAVPTTDRLAAPPTVESPTQADEGAQLFWLHCQPCHGDRGQGLTDEWRAQYPEEDQNCWESGCHGRRPYEEGFQLPDTVPAVIGPGSLQKFASLGQVYAFIRASMPFQDPGNLSDEEYLAITAFLARAHDAWPGAKLNADSVREVRFPWAPAMEIETATPTPAPDPEATQVQASADWLWAGAGLTALALGGAWLWRRRSF